MQSPDRNRVRSSLFLTRCLRVSHLQLPALALFVPSRQLVLCDCDSRGRDCFAVEACLLVQGPTSRTYGKTLDRET